MSYCKRGNFLVGAIFALRENYPHVKIKLICLYEGNSSIVKITPTWNVLPTYSRNFPLAKITMFTVLWFINIICLSVARRGCAEVAGWTLDRKIRVRFPAYPHRVWALWWQGGKRRLRTSRCPCRGSLSTLKTPSCPWRGCLAAGQNLETGHLSRHYIAEISLNVTLNHNQHTHNSLSHLFWNSHFWPPKNLRLNKFWQI